MKPTWERGNVRLYLGDCREVLPTLGKVDAVVTDPPFGIGFKYATHIDTPEGYGAWLWERIEMAEAACAPGSPVFVWQSGTQIRRLGEWFPREWRLYIAAKNFVQIRPTPMQWSFDPVVCWWTVGDQYNSGSGRDFGIAQTHPRSKDDPDYVEGHPCPRPLGQVTTMLGQFTRPDGTILDPFMGSGTTGVAAVKTGRAFLGVEIDPTYFEIAVRRIDKAIDAGALFESVSPAVRETSLFETATDAAKAMEEKR
jgi:hypothetical protein